MAQKFLPISAKKPGGEIHLAEDIDRYANWAVFTVDSLGDIYQLNEYFVVNPLLNKS